MIPAIQPSPRRDMPLQLPGDFKGKGPDGWLLGSLVTLGLPHLK